MWGPVYGDGNMAEIPRMSPTHHHRGFCIVCFRGEWSPSPPSVLLGSSILHGNCMGHHARGPYRPIYMGPGPFPWSLECLEHCLRRWPGCPHPQQTRGRWRGRVALCGECMDTARISSVISATHAGFTWAVSVHAAVLTVGPLSSGLPSMVPPPTISLSRANCMERGWASWV